jgi:hypothetical protein
MKSASVPLSQVAIDQPLLFFGKMVRADIPALVAELRAAREVVEAAAQRIGGSHAMVCDAYALGPGTTCDCGRDDLAAALAAYRAVVGEQE